MIVHKDGVVYKVGNESDGAVGQFVLRKSYDSDTLDVENGLSLWSVQIYEQYRGKGYGHMLMHDVIGEAKSLGAKSIQLYVTPDNVKAQNLYKRHGFQHVATGIGRHGLYYDCLGDAYDTLMRHLGIDPDDMGMSCSDVKFIDEGCPNCAFLCVCELEWSDLCNDIIREISPYMTEKLWYVRYFTMFREVHNG